MDSTVNLSDRPRDIGRKLRFQLAQSKTASPCDNWRIHDRVEFPVSDETVITDLDWGITFEVHHGTGQPTRLLLVEVSASSPFGEHHTFPLQSPNRVVPAGTPYRSTIYNIPPRYTINGTGLPRSVLITVTITYEDNRMFNRGFQYRESFHGRFSVGPIQGGGWYIRAQHWDAPGDPLAGVD